MHEKLSKVVSKKILFVQGIQFPTAQHLLNFFRRPQFGLVHLVKYYRNILVTHLDDFPRQGDST